MNPGDLRHKILVQKKTVSGRDEFNAEIITWSTVTTVMAAYEPLKGNLFIEAQRLQADVDCRFRMRYRNGIETTMKVVMEGRIFLIMAPPIDVYGKRREMHLMCKELVGQVVMAETSGSAVTSGSATE